MSLPEDAIEVNCDCGRKESSKNWSEREHHWEGRQVLRGACCWLQWGSCSLGYIAQSPNNCCPSSLGFASVIALESILVTNSMAPSVNHKFLGGKDQFFPALCPPAH